MPILRAASTICCTSFRVTSSSSIGSATRLAELNLGSFEITSVKKFPMKDLLGGKPPQPTTNDPEFNGKPYPVRKSEHPKFQNGKEEKRRKMWGQPPPAVPSSKARQSDHFDTACTAPISIRQHRS